MIFHGRSGHFQFKPDPFSKGAEDIAYIMLEVFLILNFFRTKPHNLLRACCTEWKKMSQFLIPFGIKPIGELFPEFRDLRI